MRKLLSALLLLSLSVPADAARIVAPLVQPGGFTLAPAAASQAGLLRGMEAHLSAAQSLLNPASTLPALSALPVLPALSFSAGASEQPAQVRSAAEYLSRQALAATAPQPESAAAARLVGAALANPVLRAETAEILRASGEDGRRVAERLEQAAQAVAGRADLAQLSRDMASGAGARDAGRLIAELFDGRSLSGLGEDMPLEAFVGYAARRFGAGREAPVAALARSGASIEAMPGDSDLSGRVELSPLTNPEREAAVYDLFRQAGASEAEIISQDIGRGSHNFMVVKKGRTDRVVVVGGHHDKVHQGAGTIDNWTGATMVISLYQAMKDLDTEATYVFMTFGREEEGLVGSQKYVASLTRQQIAKIDAMLNLDTMAVDGTFSWRNKSDRVLLDMFAKLAKAKGLDLKEVSFSGGDSDQTSFRRAGIPGGMLYGASEDVIWDIIHSENDTFARFSFKHYKNAFLLALETLKHLDVNRARPAGFWGWLAGLPGRWAAQLLG